MSLSDLFVQRLEARSVQRENEGRQEVPATGFHRETAFAVALEGSEVVEEL